MAGPPPQGSPPPAAPAAAPSGRPGAGTFLAVGLAALVPLAAFVHLRLRPAPPAPALAPGAAFADDFQRDRLGPDWWSAGGHWQIRGGELWSPAARNNPLWLGLRLPRDVAIEFRARSETATGPHAGDIKVEVFGDGRQHASGYVLVFGGWGNQVSTIARLDEHGPDRRVRNDRRVEAGRTYRMRIERRGGTLRWLVDGETFLTLEDPEPLAGPGHDRFAFSSWDADLFFDDLRIEPL
jgi:hypothetical protein